MNCSPIKLRFISKDINDYVINIWHVKNKYLWDYHSSDMTNHHLMYYTNQNDIINAIRNMVNSIDTDNDTYQFVQVSVPAFPPLRLSIDKFISSSYDICNIIRNSLNNKPVLIQHSDLDQLVNDEDESDEDDDLPPLIPLSRSNLVDESDDCDDLPSLIPISSTKLVDNNDKKPQESTRSYFHSYFS